MPNTDPNLGGVFISTAEIFRTLVKVEETVKRLEAKFDSLEQRSDVHEEDAQDHEARLRALERWKYALPISAVTSVGAAAATLLKLAG